MLWTVFFYAIQTKKYLNVVSTRKKTLFLLQFLSSSLYHIVIEGKYYHVLSDYLSTERPSRDFHFNAAKQVSCSWT